MTTATVLGAGAMGSAICNPLVEAGWNVRLWGTWLDDHLIDAIEHHQPHPRTGAIINSEVTTFRSDELATALADADVVIMAVASVGVAEITRRALSGIAQADALWLTSKGFYETDSGEILLLPEAIRQIAKNEGVTSLPPIVAIAGPVKANECAQGEPTATIFGCSDAEVAHRYAREAASSSYAIQHTQDEVGVEICAPMKNVYAIALGISDGLEEATERPHHNLKAATFAQAVREMSLLGAAMGADPATAFGLAGVGDLEVTGLSGRNKVYGMRIGRGEKPDEALAEMARLEQTVEGVPAAGLAKKLIDQLNLDPKNDLPLFAAVDELLNSPVDDVKHVIAQAVLPRSK
ncbi:NAD(P)H-dependent glycerol-3-phosphate dehydrogenase [uncultured Tessaracoccus sp.]|uniref:NAD(P)H-dependent glycerol-3-phosphate dehydrogenase n=1 Tax=uncultured Tessaracoccus sp. TaxID=905023 RepID=UPI002611A5E9|nr:NAD(P)H-dependent glycerol-3-phosphate dehydrogenase [uncultured Tessaracoccus sp.]